MSVATPRSLSVLQRIAAFSELCKPRVNTLIVFTAMIGMLLAAPGFPPLATFLIASAGIALVAGAAAAINCLVERTVDARMARTSARATARGEISPAETLLLALVVGGIGLALLHVFVNDLTMWLTLATFLGYAVIYTAILKPATPMNIVIGGASGAMPPVLGWAAITGQVSVEAMALFLIIFMWTPPHFWALAIKYRDDYAAAGVPMLPVVRSLKETARQILAYSLTLLAVSLVFGSVAQMQLLYFGAAIVLGAALVKLAIDLLRDASARRAMRLFHFSITYLGLLFLAIALDVLIR